MATGREHFALDWIKSELFQTLNDARQSLEAYVESERDETRMRACLTGLHQVHGTLVMLELPGLGLLADHLELLAQRMLNGTIEDEAAASQTLMQGILELPGHIEEIQQGRADGQQPVLKLVNEVRGHLGEDILPVPGAVTGLDAGASDASLARFQGIDGTKKVRKIRAAYQQVLLGILKGQTLDGGLAMLAKVAQGLERVCDGTPHMIQWRAFSEFVASLAESSESLPADAVKLLRRIDSEIRTLAQTGAAALKKPVSTDLVQQLLDAATQRGRKSEMITELREQLASSAGEAGGLLISGRQALASAAGALREELALVKDQLDLSVRTGQGAPDDLITLVAPLKQIGSTLSLLGFESSRTIVADQVEVLNQVVEGHALDQATLLSVASALVQVDENLASFTQGGKDEVEKITDDAQRAVTAEARQGLELVKQSIVDFVSSKWDTQHLEQIAPQLAGICGALDMIPLPRASRLLASCSRYITEGLMRSQAPKWSDLDHLAEAISGVDYYLERLAEENGFGAEDILDLSERSLVNLGVTEPVTPSAAAVSAEAAAATQTNVHADAPPPTSGAGNEAAEVGEEPPEPKLAMDDDPGFDLGNLAMGAGMEDDDTPADAAQVPVNRGETPPDSVVVTPADEAHDATAPAMRGADPVRPEAQPEEPVADLREAPIESAPRPVQPVRPSMGDTFESDPEIIEIFVEEVDEVLEAIREWLPQWRSDLRSEAAISEVRRAFHTLKGSGRIVGANVIGEVAWSVENMLNRLIDATVEPTEQFVTVVNEALALIPALRDAFEQQMAPDMDGIALVMERADMLSSGGGLEEADAAHNESGPAESDPVATEARDAQEALDVFAAEAASHLDVLRESASAQGVALNEATLRALHTLAGSAGMAGMDAIADLARPTYELAQALKGIDDSIATGEHADFFRKAYAALGEAAADLAAGREAEDQLQLIADADHLLVAVSNHPEVESQNEARESLLGLRGLAVIMDAPEFLENWHSGAMDLEYGDRLHSALSEVGQSAREVEQHGIALLADSLAVVHVRLADEVLSAEQLAVMSDAYDGFLAIFDALAADQSIPDVTEWVAELDALLETADQAEELGVLTDAAEDSVERAPVTPRLEAIEDKLTDAGGADVGNVVAFPRGTQDEDLPGETAGEDISLDDLSDRFLRELRDDAESPSGAGDKVVDAALPPAGASDSAPTGATQDDQPGAQPPSGSDTPAAPGSSDAAGAGLLLEDLDEEIIEVFFEEADEIVESLDENIHQWSTEPGNRLYLEHLLRGLHTLKGGARLSGLTQLGDVTHEFESFLIDVQNDDAPIAPEVFTALTNRFDDLTQLLAVIKATVAGEAIEASGPAPSAAGTDEPAALPPPVEPQALKPAQIATRASAEAPSPGAADPVVTGTEPADDGPAEAPEQVAAEAREKPEQQRNAQEMVRVGSGLLENLVNLAGESSIVRARIEQGMSDFVSALDEMETTIERVREQLRRLEIETETQILFRQDRPEGPKYEQFDPLEMDRYSQLQQLSRGLSESASDMLDLKETLLFKARESETLLLQQARINTELQEGLMRTRMVPFSRLLPRLRRIVRQVAGELGKEVEFHAYNAEGELDRNLLDRMIPPLEHMLRNAVDHGIESKELRQNYGKPASGRIDLRLSREGGDVVIEISDDGAGIDVESVRAKAVERGLMAESASMRDDEISQFVLAPGFTTAKSVTQISGRGVGMDVVHSEVKQLGGSIQIASRQGKGTRFIVRVPFTVSVNRALMVSVGDDLYAIPLNNIEGIVLLSPEELERLYAPEGNTFEYAGIPYRVRYLGHYLGREFRAAAQQSSVPVVLVRSGDHAVAIHVDGVQGSREIVVKSLGPQFAGVGGISGATILGDGSVVVILDLLALIRAQSSGGLAGSKRLLSASSRTRCVMVVDDSVTVRKVTSRLLERQGMDVIVAKDGIEAISLLQERRPDIMLLDIEMPRMDGFEVARQVRHDDRLSDLPIVMISSRTGEKHQEHAAQLGVNSFLGKPFQENELLATIDQLVD